MLILFITIKTVNKAIQILLKFVTIAYIATNLLLSHNYKVKKIILAIFKVFFHVTN